LPKKVFAEYKTQMVEPFLALCKQELSFFIKSMLNYLCLKKEVPIYLSLRETILSANVWLTDSLSLKANHGMLALH
jgi:hypothetical protein